MSRFEQEQNFSLDEEWVELIMRARKMGMTIEDIRDALEQLKDDGAGWIRKEKLG